MSKYHQTFQKCRYGHPRARLFSTGCTASAYQLFALFPRYVDDFVLFAGTKRELHRARTDIVRFLQTLRLRIHENRAQPRPTTSGITFLGYRISRGSIRVKRDNLIRARRRIKRLHVALEAGRMTRERYRASLAAWQGHLSELEPRGWTGRKQLRLVQEGRRFIDGELVEEPAA